VSSYSTPARVRFPRSIDTGVVPTVLAPGSFAVNWADRKVYVGDAAGIPIRFSQWVDDWSPTLAYREGDFVINDGELYRALVDLPPGTPFTDADWATVTGSDRAKMAEPFASSILTGGVVTNTASPAFNLDVAAGTAVLVSGSGLDITSVQVSWGDTALLIPSGAPAWRVVWVDTGGVVTSTDMAAILTAARRDHAILAYVLVGQTDVDLVINGSVPAGDTAESFRDAYIADGGAYRFSGLRAKADADLSVDITAGGVFALGGYWRVTPENPNMASYAARTAVPLQYASRDRLRGAPVGVLAPALWDNGTSTLQAVPSASATIQFITMDLTGAVYVQYGQALYASTTAALDALADAWDTYAKFTAGGPTILLGAAVMRGDATIGTANTIVVAANRGDPFAIASQGESSQYFLVDGSRPLTGNMDADGFEIIDAVIDGGAF
jgi:hypothetical protein